MRWLILSGAVHNFNMYAIGAFITPFLMRYHGADIQQANLVSMIVYGVMGAPGLLIGGFVGDAMLKKRRDGRMLLATAAIAVSIPLLYFRAQTAARRNDLVFNFDGRGRGGDVFLLFDRLFDDSGHRRTGFARHGDVNLFSGDVCFGRVNRTLCDRNFKRFFHQTRRPNRRNF